MASGTFTIESNSEVVIRESDGAACGVIWLTGTHGALLGMHVVELGEGE